MVKFAQHPGPFDTLTNEDINDVIDSRLFTVVCENGQFFYTIKIKLKTIANIMET